MTAISGEWRVGTKIDTNFREKITKFRVLEQVATPLDEKRLLGKKRSKRLI